jgi:hypothetical protein
MPCAPNSPTLGLEQVTASDEHDEDERCPAFRTRPLGLKRVTWGRRVSGDVHGVTLERDGVKLYYAGPFVPIHRDGQTAIVRWG